MTRSVTLRFGAALAATVFAATSGITGMEAHPLSAHGPHAGELLALEIGSVGHAAGHHGGSEGPRRAEAGRTDQALRGSASGAPGHSGHSRHGPSGECTCVGPCAGVTPPTIAHASFATLWLGGADQVRVVPVPVRLIPLDPRSHLLPFPNGPPSRV